MNNSGKLFIEVQDKGIRRISSRQCYLWCRRAGRGRKGRGQRCGGGCRGASGVVGRRRRVCPALRPKHLGLLAAHCPVLVASSCSPWSPPLHSLTPLWPGPRSSKGTRHPCPRAARTPHLGGGREPSPLCGQHGLRSDCGRVCCPQEEGRRGGLARVGGGRLEPQHRVGILTSPPGGLPQCPVCKSGMTHLPRCAGGHAAVPGPRASGAGVSTEMCSEATLTGTGGGLEGGHSALSPTRKEHPLPSPAGPRE